MIKVITGVHRKAGVGQQDFERYWREGHAPLAARMPGLRKYVLNLPHREGPWDGLVELWFDDDAAMARAFESPEGQTAMEDMDFIDHPSIQSQRFDEEVILDDTQAPADPHSETPPGQATLVYLPGRGVAEPIRFLLELGGWDWDEDPLGTKANYLRAKEETLHGTVPFLRVQDGLGYRVLEQPQAIIAYLARRAGIYPAGGTDRYRADMLLSLIADFRQPIAFAAFQPDYDAALESLHTETGPRFLPSLESALRQNETPGYFVGSGFSVVDALAFEALIFYGDYHPDGLGEYALLSGFVEKTAAHPILAAYLDSPRRRGLPDAEYVRQALEVLL